MKWLEVSLATSAENAEAVADVLARFAPGGTAVLGEPGRPEVPLTVRAYLAEDHAAPETQQRLRQALWHLSQISELPEPSLRWIEGEDWAESWKSHFQPMVAGRLIIVPAWMKAEDPQRQPLFLDPGMAFGTGAHPSTRLSLEALETVVRPGDLVVDIGCGSGILSIAAILFGAGRVLACDLDEQALAASRRGAALNRVASRLELFPGSLPELAERLGGRPPADLVVANILAPVLCALLDQGLARMVRPGGHVILSGILSDQRGQVGQAAGRASLTLAAESFEQDWCALTYRRIEGAAPQTGRRPEPR